MISPHLSGNHAEQTTAVLLLRTRSGTWNLSDNSTIDCLKFNFRLLIFSPEKRGIKTLEVPKMCLITENTLQLLLSTILNNTWIQHRLANYNHILLFLTPFQIMVIYHYLKRWLWINTITLFTRSSSGNQGAALTPPSAVFLWQAKTLSVPNFFIVYLPLFHHQMKHITAGLMLMPREQHGHK